MYTITKALILLSISFMNIGNEANSIMSLDGVTIYDSQNAKQEVVPSDTHYGYYATNMFSSYWNQPKKYFTDKPMITNISSLKKIILKGAEYDGETLKKLLLFKVKEVELGSTVIHKNNGAKWDSGKIVVFESEEYITKYLRKNTISTFEKEITIVGDLEKDEIYCLWINRQFHLFRITN